MAGNLSDYAEKAALDWLLLGATPTRPSAIYLGLFNVTPSDTGGGTEVVGGGYTRQAATFAATTSGTGQTSNTNTVTFTANGANWGAVVGLGLYDAASGGNLLFYGPLLVSKTISDTDSFTVPPGNLTISLD